jgi:hypothetical protein
MILDVIASASEAIQLASWPSFRGARETSEPGIHRAAKHEEKWIPGSMLAHRPGMADRMVAGLLFAMTETEAVAKSG